MKFYSFSLTSPNSKITTIKIFRVVFDLGLKEAKDLVEALDGTGKLLALDDSTRLRLSTAALTEIVHHGNLRLDALRRKGDDPFVQIHSLEVPFYLDEASLPEVLYPPTLHP